MKEVASMVLLLVLFAATNVGAADRVEVFNGSLRVAQPAGQWQQTDVVVTPEAQKYPVQWQQAFKNPGAIVPVKTSVKRGAMLDAAHQQENTILELGVAMIGNNVIDVVPGEGRVISSEPTYNPYIFFWAAAMLLMALSNWLIWRGRNENAAAFVVAAAIAAAAIAAFAAAAIAAIAIAIAFAFAIFAFVAFTLENSKAYQMAVAIFYMVMIVSIIAFYA